MNDIPTEIQIEAMQKKYGLSYHINYAMHAQKLIGFKGKRVLEVGGSLPREFVLDDLGAAKWVAIEHREYWDEVLSTGNVTGTPPVNESAEPSVTGNELNRNEDYQLLFGSIETLPKSLFSQFDLIFSIAAFEHIARLPEALEKMYNALVPGGKLFSLFAPIWSSHSGHHLPDITDKAGNVFKNDSSSPIPSWGHLLYNHMELYDFLLQKCDAETAREIVYFVYESPHINRFFLEDYLAIIERSSFTVNIMAPQWPTPMPDNIRAQLTRLHPTRSDFSHCGVLLVLERPQ